MKERYQQAYHRRGRQERANPVVRHSGRAPLRARSSHSEGTGGGSGISRLELKVRAWHSVVAESETFMPKGSTGFKSQSSPCNSTLFHKMWKLTSFNTGGFTTGEGGQRGQDKCFAAFKARAYVHIRPHSFCQTLSMFTSSFLGPTFLEFPYQVLQGMVLAELYLSILPKSRLMRQDTMLQIQLLLDLVHGTRGEESRISTSDRRK